MLGHTPQYFNDFRLFCKNTDKDMLRMLNFEPI